MRETRIVSCRTAGQMMVEYYGFLKKAEVSTRYYVIERVRVVR